MTYKEFDRMRTGSTDLANLISVLTNQDDYEDHIKTVPILYAPELQIKAYLRTFPHTTGSNVRQFLTKLDNSLLIVTSELHQARRTVGNWTEASPVEKHSAWTAISRVFNNHGTQLDLYLLVKHYFNF
jgi:hypothetical protein